VEEKKEEEVEEEDGEVVTLVRSAGW